MASGSVCSIKKSRFLIISKYNSFDPSAWSSDFAHKGEIIKHLGAPLGVNVSNRMNFDWVVSKIQGKIYFLLHFWERVMVIKTILMS